MSMNQRIVVRYGLEANIPSLHLGELGMDTDTLTLRLGRDTPNPLKIMTTGSTGVFDFSTVEKIILPNIEFAEGAGIGGVDFESLAADDGIVISLGSGQFRQCAISSSDGSVIITNPRGQSGDIDIRVSSASISNALGDIRQELIILGERIDDIDEEMNDDSDTMLKLIQLTGRPAKATELGTFLGETIPDNATIKTALQALETAMENLGSANFNLEIEARDEVQIAISLTPDDIVVLEAATPDLAGLLTAQDKTKLDYITVTEPIELSQIGVQEFVADEDDVTLVNSNLTSIQFPMASSLQAGAIPATDKVKLDYITATSPHNLDNFDGRITNLENFQKSPTFYAENNIEYFVSTDSTASFTFDLTAPANADVRALVMYYDRVMEGFEFEVYDAITVNDIEVVKAENITKSYRGAVTFLRSVNGDWYYVNPQGVAVLLGMAEDIETLEFNCGTTNAIEIRGLELI